MVVFLWAVIYFGVHYFEGYRRATAHSRRDRIASMDPWANGGFLVKLKDGFEVEMSRRQAQKFKELMSL